MIGILANKTRNRNGMSWLRIAARTALFPLFLAGFALWLGGEYRRANEFGEATRRSIAQRQDVQQLLSLVQDAETGQRGYVITGNPGFLMPYADARKTLAARLKSVKDSVAGNAIEMARYEKLKSLIDAKFAEMQLVLDIRDRDGLAAAAAHVSDSRGKQLMDQIRTVVQTMIASESAALNHSRAAYREGRANTQKFIWRAIVVIGVIACFVGYLIGKGSRARHQLAFEKEESAIRQRAIFDRSTDGIILINPSGSIETINPAAERMFGYEANELLRRDISTLVDIAPGVGAFLERLGLHGEELAHGTMIGVAGHHKDGSAVHVDVVLGTMPLPDGVHIVAALRDISVRKEVELMKDEFISTVSHELRTPLTSVLGSLSLLRSGAAGEMAPQAHRLAVIAENNCQRLIRLINDILDIDKIHAGTMAFDYDNIDLRDVTATAVQAMHGLAQQNSVSIISEVPDVPIMVRADVERLVQVATNLLSNAVRYSPEGTSVRIVATAPDGLGVIQVSDQGPGISDEFKRHIFSRFAQGTRPNHHVIAGTGLGLAISREIVRNHGGEIWFDNRREGGAVFSFSVPRWSDIQASETPGATNLLICEDDRDAGEIVQKLLASQGLHADIVRTAREAQMSVMSGKYVALLLDLGLPDGSGIDVIRFIRSSEPVREMPIVIISGADPRQTALPPGSVDIIDWIEKPIEPSRLVHAVELAIARTNSDQPLILHVEDDRDTLEIFSTALSGRGRVVGVSDLASARAFLRHRLPDVVILDLGLPDGSGADLLPILVDPDGGALPTIIYSAQDISGELQRSVDAVLTKSRRTLPSLVATVSKILDGKKRPVG